MTEPPFAVATLAYIGDGQRVTASRMNTLWAEFDRKMTVTMDGKSWLMWDASILGKGEQIVPFLGKKFFFTDITTFGRSKDWAGASNPNYNHSVFSAVVAAGTELGADHAKKIVTVDVPALDLDESLEAHRRSTLNADGNPEDYWVWQDGKDMPQRLHRYAVAELVFEEEGTTSWTIPKEYNKYQYFRCHNLNAVSITVTFEALPGLQTFSIAIPAYGCNCVQRRPAGQLEAGYNYFFKFKPGDPRSLTTVSFGGNLACETMRVNNVWNPALLYEIVELFSQREGLGLGDAINPVRMIRDPHVVYDISHLYRGYFADPAVGSTLLGDVLHHKGTLHYNYRDSGGTTQRVLGKFNGYGNLASLTGMGLTVVASGTGVTIQGTLGNEFNDVVTPGTNLLYGDAGEVVTAAEISSARAIEHSQPIPWDANPFYSEMFLPVVVATGTTTAQYRDFTVTADNTVGFDPGVDVSYSGKLITTAAPDETDVLYPHADTVETALLFNTFGVVVLNGTNQNCDARTLQNRRMVLTIFGPMMLWEEKYDFMASAVEGSIFSQSSRPIISPGRPYCRRDGSGKLVEHHYALWGGYGWPEYPTRGALPRGTFNGATGAFIGPRRTRSANELLFGGKHPNYGQAIDGPNGEDFTVIPLDREETEIRLLFTPGYESPAAGHMPVWESKDQLIEYEREEVDYDALRPNMQATEVTSHWMPRVKMLREHYNTMASWVNSIVKARPFSWSDFTHYLAATSESGNGVAQLVQTYDGAPLSTEAPPVGTRGILGTSIRPIGQYCSFEPDSFLHHLFTALGVTIKDETNLPSSFLAALSADAYRKYFHGTYTEVLDSVTNIGTNLWDYKSHKRIDSISQLVVDEHPGFGVLPYHKIGQHNATLVFDATNPSWPSTGTPGDDTIVVEDYLWVTIPDVRSKAEAMGLKFFFEEVSLPLALVEFTVGDSFTKLIGDGYFVHNTVNTATPATPGDVSTQPFGDNPIVDNIQGTEMFPYDVTRVRFVPSTTSPEWKRDLQFNRLVADVLPADVHAGPIGAWNWVIHYHSTTDYDRQEYWNNQDTAQFAYKWCQLVQIAANGYSIQSGTFRVPVPWFTYSSSDFSLQSDDNARARSFLDNRVYPFVAAGSYSTETFEAFGSGSNFVEPLGAGVCTEVLQWSDVFVNLQ